jgi:hypothetical protein
MHHNFLTLINKGGPLCTIQRLKPYAINCFQALVSVSTCAATPGAVRGGDGGCAVVRGNRPYIRQREVPVGGVLRTSTRPMLNLRSLLILLLLLLLSVA